MTSLQRLRYQCHHCLEEAKIATPGCKTCGSTSTSHFVLDPLTSNTTLVCNACNEIQTSQDRPPIDCLNCHQGMFDWWDSQENTWFKLDLQPKTTSTNDVWVKGDFDGDYEGVLKPEFRTKSETPGNAHYFDILFKQSFLKNIVRIPNPPTTIGPNEIRPFTSPLIFPVDVQTPHVNSEEPQVNRVVLRDFRLHEWEFVGSVESAAHEATKRFGRIKGTGYGIVQEHDPKKDIIEEEPKNIVEQAVTELT